MLTFVALEDAWGRPVLVRPETVAAIEGALDPGDKHGDLWAQRPIHPYRRITLTSGHPLYLADTPTLLPALTES